MCESVPPAWEPRAGGLWAARGPGRLPRRGTRGGRARFGAGRGGRRTDGDNEDEDEEDAQDWKERDGEGRDDLATGRIGAMSVVKFACLGACAEQQNRSQSHALSKHIETVAKLRSTRRRALDDGEGMAWCENLAEDPDAAQDPEDASSLEAGEETVGVVGDSDEGDVHDDDGGIEQVPGVGDEGVVPAGEGVEGQLGSEEGDEAQVELAEEHLGGASGLT